MALPNCAICRRTLFLPATLGGCSHVFCCDHIGRWLREHDTCPLCREPVRFVSMASVAVSRAAPQAQAEEQDDVPASHGDDLVLIVRTTHDDMTIAEVAAGQGCDAEAVLRANKMRVVRPFPPFATIHSRLRRGTDVWLS